MQRSEISEARRLVKSTAAECSYLLKLALLVCQDVKSLGNRANCLSVQLCKGKEMSGKLFTTGAHKRSENAYRALLLTRAAIAKQGFQKHGKVR